MQDEVMEVGSDGLGELPFKDDTKRALAPGQLRLVASSLLLNF